MSDNPQALLGQAFLDAMDAAADRAVDRAIQKANANGHPTELLKPEELAARLKVPRSWVYEQSRLGNIPKHQIGKYIRFDLQEVLASQKKS